MQEKKRQKEEREIIQRLKPLAKLQTGQDFEDFVEGIICKHLLFHPSFSCLRYFQGESTLRKRIQELQHYRRMGLTSMHDIERYESDLLKRVDIMLAQYITHLTFFFRPKRRLKSQLKGI